MAKPLTFNKKDNEKKKQTKKLEKQKKKEERKISGKSSLDDMIAYVDENGMITSTPPEERKKEEIEQESIQISTPKKERSTVFKGRVEYFDASKGYGFIKDLAGVEKYFFHISNAPKDIAEGQVYFFDLQRGTKGLNAVNIRLEE